MKILHAPTDVGGNAWGLSQGERAIGLDSTVAYYASSWLNYPCDINLQLDRYSRLRAYCREFIFLIKALAQYDVFHFNYGTSLINLHAFNLFDVELPLYRLFGKKVVVTYNGCDARQKGYCISRFDINACSEPDCYGGGCNEKNDNLRRKRIRHFSKYADKVFTVNPDLLHVLPNAEYVPYTIPDFHELISTPVVKNEGTGIKIMHAPSNRGAKGTKYILPVLERIQAEDKNVEVVFIENVPYRQAREIYRGVDLIIDQVLLGGYGGLAVECMALGKPVVCYMREEDYSFVPPQMKREIPVIRARPDTLYDDLKRAIEERDKWPAIGEKGREYVMRWHDPVKIAERMRAVYE